MLSGLESLLRTLVAALVVILGWVPTERVLVNDGSLARALQVTVGNIGFAVGGGIVGIDEILDGLRADALDTEALDDAGPLANRTDRGAGFDEADLAGDAADIAAEPDDEELDDAATGDDPASIAGADVETLDGADRVFDDFENLDDLILPDVFDDFEDLDDAIVGTATAKSLDTDSSGAHDAAEERGGAAGGGNGGRGGGGRNGGGGGGRTGGNAGAGDSVADRDCADFSSQAEAQTYFDENGGGVGNDVDGLDRNGDGLACEDFDYDGVGGGGGGRRAGTAGGGEDGGRDGDASTRTVGGGNGGGRSGGGAGGVSRNPQDEDRNCDDFNSQPRAQAYFEEKGGDATNNVAGLDDNGNGQACEDFAYETGVGNGAADGGGTRDGGRPDGAGGGNGGGGRSESGSAGNTSSRDPGRTRADGEAARSEGDRDVAESTVIRRSADGGMEIEIDRGGNNNRPRERSRAEQAGEATSGARTRSPEADRSARVGQSSRQGECRTQREGEDSEAALVEDATKAALATLGGQGRSDGERKGNTRSRGGECRPTKGDAGPGEDRGRD